MPLLSAKHFRSLLSDGKTPYERLLGIPFNGPVPFWQKYYMQSVFPQELISDYSYSRGGRAELFSKYSYSRGRGTERP